MLRSGNDSLGCGVHVFHYVAAAVHLGHCWLQAPCLSPRPQSASLTVKPVLFLCDPRLLMYWCSKACMSFAERLQVTPAAATSAGAGAGYGPAVLQRQPAAVPRKLRRTTPNLNARRARPSHAGHVFSCQSHFGTLRITPHIAACLCHGAQYHEAWPSLIKKSVSTLSQVCCVEQHKDCLITHAVA